MHPGRYRAFDLSLLRFGVRPFLMVMDALAYFVAAGIIGHLTNSTFIVFALIIVLYAVAGLYRSRLTMSVLDDLPALAGRGIGAAALVTAAGLPDRQDPVNSDLLWTSALFAGAGHLLPQRRLLRRARRTPAQLRRAPDADPRRRPHRRHARRRAARPPRVRPEAGRLPRLRPAARAATSARSRCSAATSRWPRSSSSSASVTSSSRSARHPSRRWSTSCAPATGWTARSSSCPGCSRCTTSAATWTRSGACRWSGCAARRSVPSPGGSSGLSTCWPPGSRWSCSRR